MKLNECVMAAVQACRVSMAVVNKYQTNADLDLNTQEKFDATLVTLADTASQKAARAVLAPLGFAFWGEEGKTKGFVGDGNYGAIVDPLDGTNAFVIGLITSTVIVGIYDRKASKLVACAIGEPISKRLWTASSTTTTELNAEGRGVWNGYDGGTTGSVFLDVCHGFKSRDRQILTDSGNAALYASLNADYRILMPGSNGLMQALVANGRERMAGSITTAVGFPGDVCGALLVLQAGGLCKAYERTDDGALAETDPLDPVRVDALVCGNNAETLNRLAESFEAAAKVQ